MTWMIFAAIYLVIGFTAAVLVTTADRDGTTGAEIVRITLFWFAYALAWAGGWILAAIALLTGRRRSGKK